MGKKNQYGISIFVFIQELLCTGSQCLQTINYNIFHMCFFNLYVSEICFYSHYVFFWN